MSNSLNTNRGGRKRQRDVSNVSIQADVLQRLVSGAVSSALSELGMGPGSSSRAGAQHEVDDFDKDLDDFQVTPTQQRSKTKHRSRYHWCL